MYATFIRARQLYGVNTEIPHRCTDVSNAKLYHGEDKIIFDEMKGILRVLSQLIFIIFLITMLVTFQNDISRHCPLDGK